MTANYLQSKHLNASSRSFTYLFGYFILSLASWAITNKAVAFNALWLGNQKFGEFAVSVRIAHNLAHLFVMGQEATLLLFLSKYQQEPEKQTGLLLWIIRSTLLKTFAVLSMTALALHLNIDFLDKSIWLGFVCIPFVVICGIYERFFLYLKHFFISFLPRGLYHPIILIAFLYCIYQSPPSTEMALWLYALAFLISSVISFIYGYYSGFQLTKENDQTDKQKWRRAGIFYTISTLIIKCTPSIALLLLKRFGSNTESIAHFAALCSLIYGFHLLTKPFDSYLKPFIAKLHAANDIESLQRTLNFVNKIRWQISLFFFLSLTLYGKSLLSSYGDGFVQAYPSLVLFSFLTFLQYLGQGTHELLNYTGFQRELSIIMTLQFMLIVLLSVILIPSLGIWGAVLAQCIPCILASITSSVLLRRKTKLKAYFVF